MLVALVSIVIKAFAWMMTGSVALLGALLDSLLDFSISMMNFFVIRHAQTPADAEHRFGHGKAEALAALGQGALVAASAVFLIFEAVKAFLDPQKVAETGIGVAVILVSIVLTWGLVRVQRRVAAETQSVAVAADSAHYEGDLWMNAGIIAALLLSDYVPYADPVCGAAVAVILLNSARRIFVQAVGQLMDHELDEGDREKIKTITLSHPQVQGMHDLRTRRAGISTFIQLHIELDGAMTLDNVHEISDAVEMAIMRAFPDAEIIIHHDPAGHEDVSPLERS